MNKTNEYPEIFKILIKKNGKGNVITDQIHEILHNRFLGISLSLCLYYLYKFVCVCVAEYEFRVDLIHNLAQIFKKNSCPIFSI